MTNDAEDRATIWMSKQLRERVEADLGYGDSLSEWMRDAAEMRLTLETALDAFDVELPEDDAARERFLRLLAAEAPADDEHVQGDLDALDDDQ